MLRATAAAQVAAAAEAAIRFQVQVAVVVVYSPEQVVQAQAAVLVVVLALLAEIQQLAVNVAAEEAAGVLQAETVFLLIVSAALGITWQCLGAVAVQP